MIKTVSINTSNITKNDANDDHMIDNIYDAENDNNENNLNGNNNNNNIAMKNNKPQKHQHNTLSFQQMIYQLASTSSTTSSNCNSAAATAVVKESNQDVTLPFYFICLLHLANEHVSHQISKLIMYTFFCISLLLSTRLL